jgi:secreted PhoX family phosphatase
MGSFASDPFTGVTVMSNSYSDPQSVANHSTSRSFAELLQARLSRRQVLKGATLLPLLGLPLGCASTGGRNDTGEIRFNAISASTEDRVRVPQGYSTSVLYLWGGSRELQGLLRWRVSAAAIHNQHRDVVLGLIPHSILP